MVSRNNGKPDVAIQINFTKFMTVLHNFIEKSGA